MSSDFLLIRRMKQGDERAFDVFVHRYYEEILNYCRYRCFDIMYAEDLAQETFLHFFTNLSRYHFKGKTKNYLYTIAGNLCKDFYKKKKAIPADDQQMEGHSGESPMDDVLDKVMVEKALTQLSDELREIIILYYFQGLKLPEIAGVLQIGLPLVKYRLRQAKKQLGQALGEEEA